jgi:hypothetical protein
MMFAYTFGCFEVCENKNVSQNIARLAEKTK